MNKYAIFCITCFFTAILILIVELLTEFSLRNKKNDLDLKEFCINHYCSEFALNITNPASYINKFTKKFLIQLVNNATKN